MYTEIHAWSPENEKSKGMTLRADTRDALPKIEVLYNITKEYPWQIKLLGGDSIIRSNGDRWGEFRSTDYRAEIRLNPNDLIELLKCVIKNNLIDLNSI